MLDSLLKGPRLSILALIVIAVVFIKTLVSQPNQAPTVNSPQVGLGNIILNVEIADTAESRAQGLSNRQNLTIDSGMLFIFPDKKIRTFWMKDMRFPIDIIWIDEEEIVDITYNASTPSGEIIPTYQPSKPIDKVLEVNAGVASESGVITGENITIGF